MSNEPCVICAGLIPGPGSTPCPRCGRGFVPPTAKPLGPLAMKATPAEVDAFIDDFIEKLFGEADSVTGTLVCVSCGKEAHNVTVTRHKGIAVMENAPPGWATVMGNRLQECIFTVCSKMCGIDVLANRVDPKYMELFRGNRP